MLWISMKLRRILIIFQSTIISLALLLKEMRLNALNDSGNLKITNLDRLIFTKNGEFTI